MKNKPSLETVSESTEVLQEAEFSKFSPYCLDGKVTSRSRYVVVGGGNSDIWSGKMGKAPVAIKVLRPFIGANPNIKIKIRKRLWREYLTWSKLSHPNIAPCMGFSYDFMDDTPHQIPALISPWMDNGTILSYIETKKPINLVGLIVGITEGLKYLHDTSIVHGDLRGGNILVSSDGIPCLTDFGLSRILNSELGLTTTSEAAGTLRWMAPELFQEGQKVTKESDIWAYGMTLLEITTLSRPYSTFTNDLSVLNQINSQKTPQRPSQTAAPELNNILWNICNRCWKHTPLFRIKVDNISKGILDHTKEMSVPAPKLKDRVSAVLSLPGRNSKKAGKVFEWCDPHLGDRDRAACLYCFDSSKHEKPNGEEESAVRGRGRPMTSS